MNAVPMFVMCPRCFHDYLWIKMRRECPQMFLRINKSSFSEIYCRLVVWTSMSLVELQQKTVYFTAPPVSVSPDRWRRASPLGRWGSSQSAWPGRGHWPQGPLFPNCLLTLLFRHMFRVPGARLYSWCVSNALGQMGHYGGHLGPQKNMCWEKSKGCEHVFFFFFFCCCTVSYDDYHTAEGVD